MTLPTGTRLGPYEIVAPIGAGGMGEVYRGLDTRLDRSVAIKVLSSQLSHRVQIRERFEREGRAISRLSHPNICTLFDVGNEGGTDYLVMEYLEGDTLADRLQRGALPVEQVFRVGEEIAEALAMAHRQGVVHRDLKPGNIILTKGGVKLLDFGLAKLFDAGDAGMVSGSLLTEQRPLTEEGTILGTFQYMSPEQIEGVEADARSDIFALGAVLYEMVTGKRAFEGKSKTSLIAAIIDRDPPPISTIQPLAPPALERVIRTCLAKNPDDRWQSAHDIAAELRWISEAGSMAGVAAPVVVRRKRRELAAWIVASMMTVAAAALGFVAFRNATKETEPIHASILAPPGAQFIFGNGAMALSPDGRRVVFAAQDSAGETGLWIRALRGGTAQLLPGTEAAEYPFWSPDSRAIGFFAGGKLKRIDAAGGPPQTICDAASARGGTWSSGNVILFALVRDSIYQVAAGGGPPARVTRFDASRGEADHRWPWFLPDGKHFLFLARAEDAEQSSVWVGELGSDERKKLTQASGTVLHANGHLLFSRERTLLAQKFDVSSLELEGDPVPLATEVAYVTGTASAIFTASANGVLMYSQGSSKSSLVLYDRSGRETGRLGAPGDHFSVEYSPDAGRLAVGSLDRGGRADLWIHDLSRATATRFTFKPGDEVSAVWSPDGERIAFATGEKRPAYDMVIKSSRSAGAEQVLWEEPGTQRYPLDWSSDGRLLLVAFHHPQKKVVFDIWIYSIAERKGTPLIEGPFSEFPGDFSPDAKWVVYTSNESGKSEVYVQAVTGSGKWQISAGGGVSPRWPLKANEILYVSPDGKVISVPVKTGDSLEVGEPRELFDTRVPSTTGSAFDVTADGQRFAFVLPVENSANAPITIVAHWPQALQR